LYILPTLNYVFLILAIVAEAAGTTLLKMSDLGAVVGLVLIISGVAVLNLFSRMEIH
jgi:multidrug transporter EmrE-like cation transporter